MSFSSTARLAARPRAFTNPNQLRHRLSSGSLSNMREGSASSLLDTTKTSTSLNKERKAQRYSVLSRSNAGSTPGIPDSPCVSPLLQSLNTSPRILSNAPLHTHTNERRVHSSSACLPSPSSLSRTTQAIAALPRLQTDVHKPAQASDLETPLLTSGSTAPLTSLPSTPSAVDQSNQPSSLPPHPPPESPLSRARRAPSPSSSPQHQIHISTSPSAHNVHIPLPRPGGDAHFRFAPEMITVSAKRGNRLDVVADAWHLEKDCHFEWHIALPPRGVDMRAVRASFDAEGNLDIRVPRQRSGAF